MATLKELIAKGATVIDVRSSWEFAEGHVENALNIPLEEIPMRIDEIKELSIPFILYCRSGNRSGMACGILQQFGIPEVHNGGGLADMQIAIM